MTKDQFIKERIEEFNRIFPEGAFGHKHNELCEWRCSLRPAFHTFLSDALSQAYSAGEMAMLEKVEETISHSAHPYCECNNGLNAYDLVLAELKKLKEKI